MSNRGGSREAESAARRSAREATFDSLEVWTRPDRGRRRPRFTRETIAEAAIRIADSEGLEELSMRRLASELGAGTMTLYHYVRNKDELLALVSDALLAEVVVPDGELPDDWREGLTVIARRSRDALRRHPWVLDIRDDPAPGPNGLRHWDQSMLAVSHVDLSVGERFELVTAVDEYVFGFCLMERQNGLADDPQADPELGAMRDYIAGLVATGEYPALAEIWDDPGIDEAWAQMQQQIFDPGRFDRNLARLLDGFEAELEKRSRPRRRR